MKLEELNKQERTKLWLDRHSIALRCPHCQQLLSRNHKSLRCNQGHHFDMAKQGYFFLARDTSNTKYRHNLFSSRRQIITRSPLYNDLHDYLNHYIKTKTARTQLDSPVILDAGSGEGSHLWRLAQSLNEKPALIGVDLAKEGIQSATDYNGYLLSLVGDLANLPIMNDQVDFLLSIFSPANYAEFQRVLKQDGEVIKVVPTSNYLKEIRQAVNELKSGGISMYSNEDVIEKFQQVYPNAKQTHLRSNVYLTSTQKKDLVNMTPLTWQLTEAQRQSIIEQLDDYITFDVIILHSI